MKETLVQSDEKNREMKSNVTSIESNTSDLPKFTLNSPRDFASRSKDVFGKLLCLERNHETWMSEHAVKGKDHTQNFDAKKTDFEVFKKPIPTKDWKLKQTSVRHFKRPRRIWKKYSLKDVPVASDAKNTAIALQCISELRKRKKSDSDDDFDKDCGKIVFKKPIVKSQKSTNSIKLKAGGSEDTRPPKITLPHLQDE